ncbi:MAG: acyl-CoA thioesterase [Thermoanaerobaculum sp.]
MGVFAVSLRVRYAETDQMGVAHHAVYPVWFELARSELARSRGVPYGSWEARGYFLVVTEVHCRYLKPARYDQLVTVEVQVASLKSRSVVFFYAVRGENGELLAEGSTHHLLLSRKTGRPASFPEDLRKALAP